MVLNKQRLNVALSTIHEDERGYFLAGQFVDLMSYVHLNVAMGAKLHRLNNYLKFIQQDIWNIETIALRLEWQKDLWNRKQLNDALWMQFAAVDIDIFHVEIRSIFDYLAEVIDMVLDSPSRDSTQVMPFCEWFDDLREVRNSIVHRGGFTLVFLEKGKILFQVYEKNGKVLIPEIMFNKNVADFELYAGLYIGYLMTYLEDVSALIHKRLNLKKIGSNAKSYHSGLRVVRNWIQQVLDYDNKNIV